MWWPWISLQLSWKKQRKICDNWCKYGSIYSKSPTSKLWGSKTVNYGCQSRESRSTILILRDEKGEIGHTFDNRLGMRLWLLQEHTVVWTYSSHLWILFVKDIHAGVRWLVMVVKLRLENMWSGVSDKRGVLSSDAGVAWNLEDIDFSDEELA